MTYFPETKIKFADSPSVDAFGRLRTGGPYTIFDSKQVTGEESSDLDWSYRLTGSATKTYNINRASTLMTVTTTSGSAAVRQTRQRLFYQPGKSTSVTMTAVVGEGNAGIVKRLGLFNSTDGLIFEQSGSTNSFIVRSNVGGTSTETKIAQSSWNIDTFDGTGPSGITFDPAKINIYMFDMQWLGAGRVRCGFDINGIAYTAHEFEFANSATSVYMSTPNLPVRYQIDSHGSSVTGTLEAICASVSSEGGSEQIGSLRTVDRGKDIRVIPSGSYLPLLSLRLNSGSLGGTVIPQSVSILCTTNAGFRWAVLQNPTFGGTDFAQWHQLTGSIVDYDIERSSLNYVTGGILMRSGYVPAGGFFGGDTFAAESFTSNLTLGTDVDHNSDEIVLAVEHFESGNESFVGGITFRELK